MSSFSVPLMNMEKGLTIDPDHMECSNCGKEIECPGLEKCTFDEGCDECWLTSNAINNVSKEDE